LPIISTSLFTTSSVPARMMGRVVSIVIVSAPAAASASAKAWRSDPAPLSLPLETEKVAAVTEVAKEILAPKERLSARNREETRFIRNSSLGTPKSHRATFQLPKFAG
jgi:hypothetical protein